MIRIAMTDDHPLVMEGLRQVLQRCSDYEVVAEYNTGRDTLNGFKEVVPDILFLDIQLPDFDGTELCKLLKKGYPELKVIALTNFSDVSIVKNMLHKGADGYLLKSASKEILLEALQAIRQGITYLDPEIQKLLIAHSLHTTRHTGFIPKISRREKEILQLIADEFTTQEIADKLFLSIKTVETHRTSLIHKLEVRNTAGLIKKALEKGLLN